MGLRFSLATATGNIRLASRSGHAVGDVPDEHAPRSSQEASVAGPPPSSGTYSTSMSAPPSPTRGRRSCRCRRPRSRRPGTCFGILLGEGRHLVDRLPRGAGTEEQELLLALDAGHRLEGVPLEVRLCCRWSASGWSSRHGRRGACGRPPAGRARRRPRCAAGSRPVLDDQGRGSVVFAASARARPKTSAPPPGAKPTTSVMGRVGKTPAAPRPPTGGRPPQRQRRQASRALDA